MIADRRDKRKLMMVTTTAQGVLALVLGIFVLADVVTLWIIIVLALALGTANAFDNPARRSFVPELVAHGEVTNAVSLNNAVFTSARIVGPSIAGVLIATVGIGWCFVINALSFAGVIVALLLMRRKRFKFEEARTEGDQEVLCLRCVRTRTRHEVVHPRLTDEELAAVQDEVFKVLGWDA